MGKKGIFILLVLALTFGACNHRSAEKKSVRPVVTAMVELTKNDQSEVFSGFAKSAQVIKTSFRVNGLIDTLPVKVGDQLRKGQVVATLRNEDYRIQKEQSEAALDQAEAEARNAIARYRRVRSLYESDSISRTELDSARAAHEAAQAAVKRAETVVELAEKQLSYTRLEAVYDRCTVSRLYKEENENVVAGQLVAELICGNFLEVEIGVSETDISRFKAGNKVMVQFTAIPDKFNEGTISEVGVVASAGTTFPVTITLSEVNDEIRPGMAAKVFVHEESDADPIIIIPIESVNRDDNGIFVFVFVPSSTNETLGKASKRPIEIGEVTPFGIEVKKGVKPGERVVVAGIRYLRDGKEVKMISEQEFGF